MGAEADDEGWQEPRSAHQRPPQLSSPMLANLMLPLQWRKLGSKQAQAANAQPGLKPWSA